MNKILEFQIGSHLYGTATKDSDKDFSGVFLPNENQIFGFERIDQIDLSIKSKRKDGKNKSNAVDRILYEFRKFVKLALENNPNILEQLFVNKKNLIYSDENGFGKELLKNNFLFPYKGLKEKFCRYAFSQKHKMIIRTDNYYILKNAHEWFEENIKDNKDKLLLIEIAKGLPFFTIKGDNIKCGDLNFQRHHMLKKVKAMIKSRLSKAGHRKELLTKYGFDTKYGYHLIRLIKEGIELLTTGTLEFPLKYADELLDIKKGKWKMTEVLKYAGELETEIESINSVLIAKPQYNKIQEFTKNILKKSLEK